MFTEGNDETLMTVELSSITWDCLRKCHVFSRPMMSMLSEYSTLVRGPRYRESQSSVMNSFI